VLEAHSFCLAIGLAASEPYFQVVRIDDLSQTLEIRDLAMFDELTGPARQPLDDVVLELAQFAEVDLRLAELDPPRLRVPRFVDQLRNVEERFRGNASAIDAHATGVRFGIDDRGAETEIRGEKCGCVPPGPAAYDNQLSSDHEARSGRAGAAGRWVLDFPTWLTRPTRPARARIIPRASKETAARAPRRTSA
jgi:hypothetical protein